MNNGFKDQTASQRTNTMNERSYIRNVPSEALQPYLDSRPVSTKFTRMPIVSSEKKSSVPLKQVSTFDPHTIFNPGNTKSPWSGFNANNESILRNQIYAIQDCSQAAFVPSSKSDLYQVHWKQTELLQPFPDLFQTQTFPVNSFEHSQHVGYALFNNATRQQIKDLDC